MSTLEFITGFACEPSSWPELVRRDTRGRCPRSTAMCKAVTSPNPRLQWVAQFGKRCVLAAAVMNHIVLTGSGFLGQLAEKNKSSNFQYLAASQQFQTNVHRLKGCQREVISDPEFFCRSFPSEQMFESRRCHFESRCIFTKNLQ